jgi:hypothetical protein
MRARSAIFRCQSFDGLAAAQQLRDVRRDKVPEALPTVSCIALRRGVAYAKQCSNKKDGNCYFYFLRHPNRILSDPEAPSAFLTRGQPGCPTQVCERHPGIALNDYAQANAPGTAMTSRKNYGDHTCKIKLKIHMYQYSPD